MYLGVVHYAGPTKTGAPFARVQPLFEIEKEAWRPARADDFPTQGLVYWQGAREATESALIFFRAEPNPGQKDEFRVSWAEVVTEVFDLRRLGAADKVRAALVHGIKAPDLHPGRAYLWCAPDLLVGPVRLNRSPAGTLTLEPSGRERLPTISPVASSIRPIAVGKATRYLYDGNPAPTGYVDWDDDDLVLRRALRVVSRREGKEFVLTKKAIDDAADAVLAGGTAGDLALDAYRVGHARALCDDAAQLVSASAQLTEALLALPTVEATLRVAREDARREAAAAAKEQVEKELSAERERAEAERKARADVQAQVARLREEVGALEAAKAGETEALASLRRRAEEEAAEVAAEVERQVSAVLAKPAALLAQVSILRAVLPLAPPAADTTRLVAATPATTGPRAEGPSAAPKALAWARAAAHSDKVEFQKALNAAFRAEGVAPQNALRLHAAVISGLLPICVGPRGQAALRAYAQAACGGRLAVLHVAPGFLAPVDLLGSFSRRDRSLSEHPCGLRRAADAVRDIPALSLFALEGVNRAPVEAYLVPPLRDLEGGGAMSLPIEVEGHSSLQLPPGLRLAGMDVDGPSTLPISRDVWAHGVALEMPSLATRGAATPPGEVLLSSQLAQPANIPTEIVDRILEAVPQASDLRECLARFGAGLTRFYTDNRQVMAALVECAVLPYLATLPDKDERDAGVAALATLMSPTSSGAEELAALARRLRARLG